MQTHLYPPRPITKVTSAGKPSKGSQALPGPPQHSCFSASGRGHPVWPRAVPLWGFWKRHALSRHCWPPATPGHYLMGTVDSGGCSCYHFHLVGQDSEAGEEATACPDCPSVWALLWALPSLPEIQLSPLDCAGPHLPWGRPIFGGVCPAPQQTCGSASELAGLRFPGRLGRSAWRRGCTTGLCFDK